MPDKKDKLTSKVFYQYLVLALFVVVAIVILIFHRGTLNSELPIESIQNSSPSQQCHESIEKG